MRVEVILDESRRRDTYAAADFLANQGVPTKIDASHAISHHKVMVINGDTVRTGRFNFTQAAQEKNAEHVLLIQDKALASQYTQSWHAHAQHRQPFGGRGVRQEWRSGRSRQPRCSCANPAEGVSYETIPRRPRMAHGGTADGVCRLSDWGPTGLQPATDRLLTPGDIQVAQENLRALGFDPGPVNGVFTAETQAAVRAYQAREGLPVSGLLDRATRRELIPGFDRIP